MIYFSRKLLSSKDNMWCNFSSIRKKCFRNGFPRAHCISFSNCCFLLFFGEYAKSNFFIVFNLFGLLEHKNYFFRKYIKNRISGWHCEIDLFRTGAIIITPPTLLTCYEVSKEREDSKKSITKERKEWKEWASKLETSLNWLRIPRGLFSLFFHLSTKLLPFLSSELRNFDWMGGS